ncbi:MAG: nickel-binding protein [Thermodesulfobacteriota bacterium]
MPIYMDRHDNEGVSAREVADAHQKDLEIQDKHGCKAITYWVDEARGTVFCLIEAKQKQAVRNMHREAHGDVPNKVIEVDPDTVNAFLGRVEDLPTPIKPADSSSGVPVVDSAFRTIMFTDMEGSTSITTSLGDEKAMELLHVHDAIIRDAVECAISIQRGFASYNKKDPITTIHLRIGLSAGEPVSEGHDLFGSTVQLAARICNYAEPDQILVTRVIQNLCMGKKLPFSDLGEKTLRGFDEPVWLCEVGW